MHTSCFGRPFQVGASMKNEKSSVKNYMYKSNITFILYFHPLIFAAWCLVTCDYDSYYSYSPL